MQDRHLRYAANMRNYEGYSIGKLLGLINDPTVISLAGGIPSPEMFLRAELQLATQQRFDRDIDRIMQYSPIRGEAELIDAVIAFLKRDGIHVVADNTMITTSGQQGLDQKRGGGRVIGIYTFSKLFCPGMRVGFNIGPPEVIDKMTNIKEGSTLNTPKYNQDMCAAFLTEVDLEAYFERCCVYYGAKLEIFLNAMAAYFPPERSVTWTQPEGGMFLWVSMPQNVDTRQLFHTALKFKVAFVPGEAFYGERPERHHMRVNFSYSSEAQLREAVKRLSDCLGQLGI